MAKDRQLGHQVRDYLVALGLETPMVKNDPEEISHTELNMFKTIETCQHGIMEALGLDMTNDSLQDTPKRVAKMFCHEIFTGLSYDNFPKCTTVANTMRYDEMVCVRGIEVKSFCEHHFLPFVGTATVAYIPKQKVLGLSKLNRVVDFFARRPQIQERLTEQISAALGLILETQDIAVVIQADHFCVKMRGVEDTNSNTVTSRMNGRFRTVAELRAEFLSLSH